MTIKSNSTTDSSNIFDIKDYLKLSFDLINNKLASIDEKSTKTEVGLQGVIRTINQMQITDAGHFSGCPNTISVAILDKRIDKEIQIIDKKISKYEFIITYWKVFVVTGAITIVGLIFSGYFAFQKINEILNNTDQNVKNKKNELYKEKLPAPSNSVTDSYFIY